MTEEIKYPELKDKDCYLLEDIKTFFSEDSENIKSILNKIDGCGSEFGCSISAEKMCLQVPADNFKESYKLMRQACIETATMILKSNENLLVSEVNVPVKSEGSECSCFMEIKFKRK